MGTEFKARWGAAMGLAAASVIVAIAALVFIASPAFTEATASYVRVALTGIAPTFAILAVATAAQASFRVFRTPWPAALIAVVGAVATSVAYELWYAGVDSTPASPAPMLVAASASVVLNGKALAVLVRPALRQLSVGSTIAVLALVVRGQHVVDSRVGRRPPRLVVSNVTEVEAFSWSTVMRGSLSRAG